MNISGEFWMRWRVRLGFPVAAVCLWLARPTASSIGVGAAIAAAGLLVRGAAAGHLRKGHALATTGPYARTRNPLYLGSALLGAGFAVASHSWVAAAVLGGYFVAFYPAVMRREEAELRMAYGDAFEEYARRVPLFWPRVRARGGAGDAPFSWRQYVRNREYRAVIGAVAVLGVLAGLVAWRS
jgi:protein-S-isoprenylcysteine O-methyltransferase Ste14